jgi:hypothetical protein
MTTTRIQSVEIPAEEQGVLASLLRLSDPALNGLELTLSQARLTLDREELISQLREDPTLADVRDLEGIVGSLVNIAGTGYSAEVSTDEVVDAVMATIKKDDVVELTEADAEGLKQLLARLAKLKPIELIAKANELSRANERSFHSARIVTDLRPICAGEDVRVAGAVVVHQLSIRASRNGRRESTYFTLDSIDLADFSAVISRAVKKDKALREFANASNTPVLTPPAE